jgi:hypothetical protein
MTNKFATTNRRSLLMMKTAFSILIALSFIVACTSTTAYAKKKKRRAHYGQIEITTTPGGFRLRIDGRPAGDTSTTVRVIELDPGHHNLEILLSNGGRWVRDFDIEEGRKLCVNVNYHPGRVVVKTPCSYTVMVAAPPSVNDGDLITFTSDVNYGGTAPLNYAWTVTPSEARIVSGAGTPTITVDSTGLGDHVVTATLVVDDGSGDPACRQQAQASTNVVARVPPRLECKRFDEFQSVAFDDDKARFDNLAIELQNAPDSQAFVYVYAGRSSRANQADLLGRRTMDYLVNQRGVDGQRVRVVTGGYRETDYFEIWLCPRGAQPPPPTPTVQPNDVRPATERTRPRRPRRPSSE